MNAARRTDGRNSRSAPRTGIVVASRSGSSRLPGKALLPLRGQPMLLFLLRRIRAIRRADAVLLATTDRKSTRLNPVTSVSRMPSSA